jgi:hypothetical protein
MVQCAYKLACGLSMVILTIMLSASPTLATVYMWRDSAGISHYTNKEYDIPARYRAKAKALYPESSDTGKTQPNGSMVPAPASPAPPAPPAPSAPSAPPAPRQPVVTQQPKSAELPKIQPIMTTPQITSAPPSTKPRRERRQRSEDNE